MLTVVFFYRSYTEGYDGRALVNRSPSLYAASTHENNLDELKRDYAQAITEEDYSLVSVYAGVGAGLIRKGERAEDIVTKVQQELETSLAGSFELQALFSALLLVPSKSSHPLLFPSQLVAARTNADLRR
jgi:hypothetical protein